MFLKSVMVVFAAVVLGNVALAQGSYKVKPDGLPEMDVFFGTTPNTVWINGVLQPGWHWEILDADGDGTADDVRATAPDGGKADLIDGKDNSGSSSGDVRDGNTGGDIGTWSR